MKLALNIEKGKAGAGGHAKSHNLRDRPTASQLPKAAWFTKAGHHSITPWRDEVMQRAEGLAKRKDAVTSLRLVFQVGNQTDWRQAPTAEHPQGKAKKPWPVDLNKLATAVRDALVAEFGADNVVSVDLHTDESTPHVHAVVTPVHEGKLQAKHWLDGPKSMAAIRARLHETISRQVPCEYTRGAPGGEPHDAGKAAGGPEGPKEPPGLLQRVVGAFEARAEIKTLKGVIADLQEQMQGMFSSMKSVEKMAKDRFDAMKASDRKAAELQKKYDLAQVEIKRQQAEIDRLTPVASGPTVAPRATPEPRSKPNTAYTPGPSGPG